MIQLIREKLPPYVNAESYDIQVLTPMRKGNLGVEALNGILQEYLNPPDETKKEHPYGDGVFREGDKVMQTTNNYNLIWKKINGFIEEEGQGVYNGDIGYIHKIDFQTNEVTSGDFLLYQVKIS